MKAVFIGCVESSQIFLKILLEEKADIVGVITKSESKLNSDFVDLSSIAIQNDIPYLCVKDINDGQAHEFIKGLDPDIGFCLGWSQLIGKKLLDMFPKGIIGFHPAALPQNRGRHPLIWALVLGLDKTASSFFMLEEGADTGNVISQEQIEITYADNARSLYDKVINAGKEQLRNLWRDICSDNIKIICDAGYGGNVWRKRGRNDGKIDWRMSSRGIYNLVRALSEPYVGAHFEYNGCDYKVWEIRELGDNLYRNIEPGKILKVNENQSFVIKTGDGMIEVLRYNREFVPQSGMYL